MAKRDALTEVERYKPRHPWAAAALAGIVEILITFPLEYLKTQTQLMDSTSASNGGRWLASTNGPRAFFVQTIQKRGFFGLYKGLSPWLYFAVPRCVVRFGVFDIAQDALRKGLASEQYSSARGFLAGMVAGMVEGIFVVTPMHAIQTKMIHDSQSAEPQLRGFWHTLRLVAERDGLLRGFWCGCLSTTLKGTLTHAIRFGTFEHFRRAVLTRKEPGSRLEAHESMACGGLSGLLSVAVSHPIDTVKSNMQSLGGATRYSSNLDCARQIVTRGGPRALFQGMGVRSVRVTLEMGLLFTLYDHFGRVIDTATEPAR
mmetsp:Transcript_89351/g.178568  ORF Transcript_89351/g.178568 Transcript_89351/m.178568 type:complete len:315 (-) Transcript_89351:279-1223(-)